MDNVILSELILNTLKDSFIILASLTIGQSLAVSMINKINLKKISKYDGLTIKECTFTYNVASTERIKNKSGQKKLDDLLPLVEKLSSYTSKENLTTVYRNLISLKVKKKPMLLFAGTAGLYNIENNTIKYSLTSSLGHEFLHLASSYYDFETKMEYAGFDQRKNGFGIGRGLNEGYTELLATRIYNKNNKVEAYKLEVQIAKLLELFFDNPKDMEKFYFNHDLLGFVKHMEQFASTKEIVHLLLEIDNIHNRSSITFNPFGLYDSIKIQLKLYKLFASKNKDIEKLKQFTNIICENKAICMILNNKKMKLCKENLSTQNKDLSIGEENKKLH